MNFMNGTNQPPYATIDNRGRIRLNPKVPNAEDLLAMRQPHLYQTYKLQQRNEELLQETEDTLAKKGGLVGEEAKLFGRVQRERREREKGGKK